MLESKMRWDVQATDENKVSELVDKLHITPLVAKLLINRGIEEADAAESFLHVKRQTFHDPFLLKDMDKAVNRIKVAIENGEKIRIFGDYDADGVTSTTVMLTVLSGLGANVDFYIPNRFTEGYGPNEMAFRLAASEGINLLITVDTGISAVHEAALARELGMDYIITDHHEPGDILPDAFAIIHPKLKDSLYPFKELAGVGVAFKVAHALRGEVPEDLLEIAAIGTIADLVPLLGENRLIATKGIEKLRTTTRPGLLALMKKANIEQASLNEESIGFLLAPRLNAAGRLGPADPAVDLLMTEDPTEAMDLSEEINELNKERQAIVADAVKEAIAEVEEKFPPDCNSVLIVGKEGWNSGIVGIVASKLVERYYRPTIVLSYDVEKGLAKGSARSITGFDLFQNLTKCSDLLPHFGGHPMAAGMTLHLEDVPELRRRMNELAENTLTEEDFIPLTSVEAKADISEVTIQTIEEMSLLAPFGVGNPKPKFLLEAVQLASIRKIGANQNHLKLQVDDGNQLLDGVGFGLGELADEIASNSKVSLLGELAINEWNNLKKPQVLVKDVAVNHWQLFDLRGKDSAKDWITDIPDPRKIVVFSKDTLQSFPFLSDSGEVVVIENEVDIIELENSGEHLVFFDLPESRTLLERIVQKKAPNRIYVHFYHKQDHFLSTMPTREHFKWFYGFLAKKGPLDLKRYGDDLARYRGWSREAVDLISQVFFELEFVTINNGIITLISNAKKRDLEDSPTFKKQKEQFELERDLIYSSFQQLYDWFNRLVIHEDVNIKEETIQWI